MVLLKLITWMFYGPTEQRVRNMSFSVLIQVDIELTSLIYNRL